MKKAMKKLVLQESFVHVLETTLIILWTESALLCMDVLYGLWNLRACFGPCVILNTQFDKAV